MTRNKHNDPLLDYFSDLLTESDLGIKSDIAPLQAPPHPVEQEEPHANNQQQLSAEHAPSLKPAPQKKSATAKTVSSEPDTDLAKLEVLKRTQLQALLSQQVTTAAPEQAQPKTEQKTEEKTEPKKSEITEEDKAEALMREKFGQTAVDVVEESTVDHAFEQSINSVLEWGKDGRPQWAQERFDVLLFDVSGLTLAVPLVALGQIVKIGEELTPIFGQTDWFMGLLNSPQGQIKTVNTALFVMPEKYSDSFLASAKYVISIDGLPWGLAVDVVNQPISIDPDEVKWRTSRTSRPWLAGTVKSAMCALIDIPQMGAMLTACDKA